MSVLRNSLRRDRSTSHSRFRKKNAQLKPSAFHRGNINQQWRQMQRATDLAKLQSLLPIQKRKILYGNTNIDDAPETKVNFSYKETSASEQLATTKDIENIKVFEMVTVRGLVLFGDNTAEWVPTKPGLTKLEGCFLDESGSVMITIWNEQIEQTENNQYYEIENIRVRKYCSQKYLSANEETDFKKVASNLPKLSPDDIKKSPK